MSHVVKGLAFIMIGASMILNKLYGIALPFEIMLGIFLVLIGLNALSKTPGKRVS